MAALRGGCSEEMAFEDAVRAKSGVVQGFRGRYKIAGELADDYQKRQIYSQQVDMETTQYPMEVVKKVHEAEGWLSRTKTIWAGGSLVSRNRLNSMKKSHETWKRTLS